MTKKSKKEVQEEFLEVGMSLDFLLKIPAGGSGVLVGPFPDPCVGLVHSPTGIGKSLFVHEIALAVASGKSCFINKTTGWDITERPGTVAIIDGEMPLKMLQDRMKIAIRNRDAKIELFSNERLYRLTKNQIQLDVEESRNLLDLWLNSLKDLRLVILDNLATLTSSDFNEDKAVAQVDINKWMGHWRDKGVSIILVHHDGKNEDQRGSSNRLTICDTVLHILRSGDGAVQEADFVIDCSKLRRVDLAWVPFSARLFNNEWLFASDIEARLDQLIRLAEIFGGWKPFEIAEEMGIKKSRVYVLRQEAIKAGRWKWETNKRPGRKKKDEAEY